VEAADAGTISDVAEHPVVGLARASRHAARFQEIRTYYDFPDIDIDRYDIDGRLAR